MSADREILELAAKAAGYKFDSTEPFEICVPHKGGNNYFEWNPLTDDGDALRLAVRLGIPKCLTLDLGPAGASATFHYPVCGADEFQQPGVEFDPYAATRRAIVRAAAEIGKEMP